MGKIKYLSAFEHGIGRCQPHQFVSRTVTLLGFSGLTVSHVYEEWSTTQRTSSQFDTTVGSVGVNMGGDTISAFFREHMLLRCKGSFVEMHIFKR